MNFKEIIFIFWMLCISFVTIIMATTFIPTIKTPIVTLVFAITCFGISLFAAIYIFIIQIFSTKNKEKTQ